MHIVQFGARREPVLFAEMLDQLLLCHPQLGRGADQRCLGLEKRLGSLRLKQLPVGGVGPKVQRSLRVQGLGVPSSELPRKLPRRLQPCFQHHSIVLELRRRKFIHACSTPV